MDTPSPYTIDEWLSYMILRGLADEGERGTLLACRRMGCADEDSRATLVVLTDYQTPAMARYMVPAIASCTSLQSLALSLFVNPLAAASMEEQWQDIIALASAANPATLRSFTLVVNGGGLSFDKEVMSRFQRLDWSALVSSFRRTRCSEMASVAPAYGSQSATGVRVEVSSYGLLLLDSGRHLYAEHRTTTGSPATFKTHIPSGTMSFSDRKAMGEFSE